MELDKQQEKVVHSSSHNILVIASAGSGKTRVLTERIRYLIEEKSIDPKNIITITFTNQAASEMASRLSDVKDIDKAFIGTIHSLAYRALRSNDSSYKILTDELDMQLHIELIKKYCRYLTLDRYNKYKQAELQYRLGIIDSYTFSTTLTSYEKRELKEIESDYPSPTYPETLGSICKQRHIISFNELLVLATKYFKEENIISEYVFVDEFQDIGSLEYKFIMSLQSRNYFFVGDDWQSIYSFKGGNVGIFKSLYEDPNFTNYYLSTNYRSCWNIIDFSDRVIKQVKDKFNKRVEMP